MSIGDTMTLLNPVLVVSFIYDVLPENAKGVLEKMNSSRVKMVWPEMNSKRKYHLVNWHVVCMPKDYGGLGVLDLKAMNQSLLYKRLWKLENTEGCPENTNPTRD